MTALLRKIDEYNRPLHLFASEKRAGISKDITSRISNRIIKYPQNIKLEYNAGGQIKLKAGSKVYISNNGKYEEYVLKTDTPYGAGGLWTKEGSRDLFVVYCPETNSLEVAAIKDTYSTAEEPVTFEAGYALWDDISKNEQKITKDSGATYKKVSLPILYGNPTTAKTLNDAYSMGWKQGHIKCIFNGIGFIGTRVFALPDVEYLIPNGINEDGSLLNIKNKTETVKLSNFGSQTSHYGFLNSNKEIHGWGSMYDENIYSPKITGKDNKYYCLSDNKIYYTNDYGATYTQTYEAYIGRLEKAGGTPNKNITSIELAAPLNILTKTDKNNAEIPLYSEAERINIGWNGVFKGTDTNKYTAPCNGWVIGSLAILQNSSNQYTFKIKINDIEVFSISRHTSIQGGLTNWIFPIKKGDTISYSTDLKTSDNFGEIKNCYFYRSYKEI